MKNNIVMVVYAYEKDNNNVWIQGIYEDHSEGLDVQYKMQKSPEYGHLIWSSNILPIKKEKI